MTERLRRWFAGWTLRRRLVAASVCLLVIMSAIIGTVSVVALRRSLIGQLDDQLYSAAARAAEAPPSQGTEPTDLPPGRLFPTGQGEGTLTARIDDGVVEEAAVLDSSGEFQLVPESLHSALSAVPTDGHPRSQSLGELGDYRLIAAATVSGTIIVTGLPLDAAHDTIYQLSGVIAGIAVIGIAVTAIAAAVIIRLALRPLRRVASTAAQVTSLELSRGEVTLPMRMPPSDTDPRTEVGQVGTALNRLLGHVDDALQARHASESRVRQFVADASHELRTPLASIRGYAELTRRHRQPLAADVDHAIGRVESEAIRMTALVEDLLLLARLDAGRPLDRSHVDLSRIVLDATSDARAAGPDHRWQLALPHTPVLVTGDQQRLHQVVVNLLANARTHTPAGTTVDISLAIQGKSALLTVRDDGPGIPEVLVANVFQRFSRADTSRSRAAGSTGLGLAIVRAVVDAHHGSISAISDPGDTRFHVRLPLADSINPTTSQPPTR